MIAPRQTRLLRAPDLRAFQRAIAELALAGPPAACRARAVLVPTRAAADALRRTLERHRFTERPSDEPVAFVLPDLLTRSEWYGRLAECLPGPPPLLTQLDREVLVARAARAAEADGIRPPFALRPGLVAALVAFYDELKRRGRTVEAFERLLTSSLEPVAETDRGAARLLEETHFLAAVFRRYEAAIDAHALYDEHRVRARMLADSRSSPYRHVVVTVADEVVDRGGLWPADFDLLSRLSGLERLDVVATEEMLATGFHERVHERLPALEETRVATTGTGLPVLDAPAPAEAPLYAVHRDREEELLAAVRRAKRVAREAGPDALDRLAVVFERPLPYVYLARQACRAAGLPYQTVDALPLAAEPYAAALDLVFAVVLEGYTRQAVVSLLRSPLFVFVEGGRAVRLEEAAALDRVLAETKFLGGREALVRLAAELDARGAGDLPGEVVRRAAHAARAMAAVAAALAPLDAPAPPSAHIAVLRAFICGHERPPEGRGPRDERHARARAAILGALDALAAAHARYDDTPQPFAAVAASLRRWIEAQTFAPRTGQAGLHLVDADAARYGDFDEVRLVGLVETDWPESPARSILYPANLLVQLGWPLEAERRRGPRALFRDLVRLPRSRVSVSTFALESDALVRPSPFLEDLGELGLPVVREPQAPPARVFVHEALMHDPVVPEAVTGVAAAWLALRRRRSPADAPIFHGATPPRGAEVYRVSAVEQYLQCPFRYFAAHVLRLEEEPDEEPGLTPQERGRFLHQVLRAFFEEWQASGRGDLTPVNFAEAMAEFTRVAEVHLARLPEADAALERARLLGSAAAAGAAERALGLELEFETPTVERLLEHAVDGEFAFADDRGREQPVSLRGKADRIDLLADGTLRVVDYKLGRAPKPTLAIQLAVYGVAAEQQLRRARGGAWRFAAAGYVAFGEDRPFVSLRAAGGTFDEAVAAGVGRFLDAVGGIASGAFPVRPAEPFRCRFCPYPSVCRKDGVGDD